MISLRVSLRRALARSMPNRKISITTRLFSTDNARIMEGMTVLEVANVLAGPSVGQFMAELGARVIKIESPVTKGDVTRTWRLGGEASDVTAYFSSCNVNKESITLDLLNPKGREILHKLVEKADCVLASFKPGDGEKLGIDGDSLCKVNERLVYGQITGYGLDDKRVGYDAVIQAESGFQYMNGDPDGDPCKMPVALVDVISAHQLKEALLVQLWRRERTGKGGQVRVSLLNSAISALVNQATGFLREGAIPKRLGSDHPTITPYGTVFKSREASELFVVGVGSDSQFRSLCKVLDREDLSATGSKFATNPDRCKNREEIKGILAEEFKKWDRQELIRIMRTNNIPCGGINNMKDVFDQPQAQDMVIFSGEECTESRKFEHVASFSQGKEPIGLRQIAFDGTPEGLGSDGVFKRPPHYGEHTTRILRELLDYTDHDIEQAAKSGAIDPSVVTSTAPLEE